MELSDTRVLVTGGTSGLGQAMAESLARAGARVAVSSRDDERIVAREFEDWLAARKTPPGSKPGLVGS
jgi:NAD(P)-dependent dehydrogenase (short-subunit alcohol dehydrogenase family)